MAQSRVEAILQAIIDGTDISQLQPPQSRNEILLLQILNKIENISAGGSIPVHVCTSSEYDSETRIPTITNPEPETFYLVPNEENEANNLFVEWVYIDDAWEKFFEVKTVAPECGMTDDVRLALLTIAQHVAYIDDQGRAYYDALYAALYGGGSNVYPRLDVVYNPGIHTVYVNDNVESLRPYLNVKLRENSHVIEEIASNYMLSGDISKPNNVITISSSNLQYKLPVSAIDSEIIYEISSPITLDGSTYIDTGLAICDSAKDFSILIDALDNHSSTFTTGEIPILLDCMDGDNKPYPGFFFGYNTSRTYDDYCIMGNSSYTSEKFTTGQTRSFKLSIRYYSDINDFDVRAILANGEKMLFNFSARKESVSFLNKTLGIGGQKHADGSMYADRYWYGMVNSMKVFSRIISDNEIQEFLS